MKKTLNTTGIANKLKAQSVYFRRPIPRENPALPERTDERTSAATEKGPLQLPIL